MSGKNESEILAGLEGMVIHLTNKMRAFWGGRMEREDAEQEARIAAVKAIRSHREGGASMSTYVYLAIRNQFINLDIDSRRPVRNLGKSPAKLEDAPADHRERDEVDAEDVADAMRELSRLPDATRIVLNKVLLCGMKNKDVAKQLGVSRSVVSMRLYKGTKRISEKLCA